MNTINQLIDFIEHEHHEHDSPFNNEESIIRFIMQKLEDCECVIDCYGDCEFCNVNTQVVRNDELTTPLLAAVTTMVSHDMIDCLLQCGADPNQQVKGVSPLNKAILYGNFDLVQMFVRYGANVTKKTRNLSLACSDEYHTIPYIQSLEIAASAYVGDVESRDIFMLVYDETKSEFEHQHQSQIAGNKKFKKFLKQRMNIPRLREDCNDKEHFERFTSSVRHTKVLVRDVECCLFLMGGKMWMGGTSFSRRVHLKRNINLTIDANLANQNYSPPWSPGYDSPPWSPGHESPEYSPNNYPPPPPPSSESKSSMLNWNKLSPSPPPMPSEEPSTRLSSDNEEEEIEDHQSSESDNEEEEEFVAKSDNEEEEESSESELDEVTDFESVKEEVKTRSKWNLFW
jgi:hypothetical protein